MTVVTMIIIQECAEFSVNIMLPDFESIVNNHIVYQKVHIYIYKKADITGINIIFCTATRVWCLFLLSGSQSWSLLSETIHIK